MAAGSGRQKLETGCKGSIWNLIGCVQGPYRKCFNHGEKITEDVLEQLAIKNTNKGLTVPGVQKKLSLHLENSGTIPRLTLVNHPTGYILKPQTKEYPCLPEAEYLVMMMAEKSGIKTVPHALIYLQSQDSYAYITKRIDRADGRIESSFCNRI